MENVIDTLYYKWEEDNIMNTKESDTALDVLCYSENVGESHKRIDLLCYAISAENRIAFRAGFNTAVKLLMGAGQD